jgi:prepilin-type N-terminal cleavage/methylation domain-containing protein
VVSGQERKKQKGRSKMTEQQSSRRVSRKSQTLLGQRASVVSKIKELFTMSYEPRAKSQRGFTLIELAIVLVIIGIILGAVLKGQDLIQGAASKKLTSTVNGWQALIWTYMDRMGRFPGDAGRDGIIGNIAGERTATTSAIGELVTVTGGGMSNPPENPILIGGGSFWVYIGYDSTGAAANKNIIIVCGAAACATAFTNDQLNIIRSLDTAIDGRADAGLGQIRGVNAAPTVTAELGPTNNRANRVVTAVTAESETAAGATEEWGAQARFSAVWLFDRPY